MAKEDEPAEMVDPLQDLVLRLRDDEGASRSSPAGLALLTPLDRESAFGSWSESNLPRSNGATGDERLFTRPRPIGRAGFPRTHLRRGVARRMDSNRVRL